jgi:hypothetical protein
MPDPADVRREWAERIAADYESWAARVALVVVVGLDLPLLLRQHTGATAEALRSERAYWGLDPEAE